MGSFAQRGHTFSLHCESNANSGYSGGHAIPDQFRAVVLIHEPDVGIVSRFDTISAAISATADTPSSGNQESRLCLFVVDSTELKSQNIDSSTGQPFWLLHADYDWKPKKEHFHPYQVLMDPPESASK